MTLNDTIPHLISMQYTVKAPTYNLCLAKMHMMHMQKPCTKTIHLFFFSSRKIQRDETLSEAAVWSHVSDQGKDFIQQLLTKDLLQRLSAMAALEHPWLKELAPQSLEPREATFEAKRIGLNKRV